MYSVMSRGSLACGSWFELIEEASRTPPSVISIVSLEGVNNWEGKPACSLGCDWREKNTDESVKSSDIARDQQAQHHHHHHQRLPIRCETSSIGKPLFAILRLRWSQHCSSRYQSSGAKRAKGKPIQETEVQRRWCTTNHESTAPPSASYDGCLECRPIHCPNHHGCSLDLGVEATPP